MTHAARVVWVSFVPVERTARGLTSSVASCRYRMIIPAAALKQLGRNSAVTYLAGHSNRKTLLARFDNADAAVIGKLTSDERHFAAAGEAVLGLVSALQARGVKVLADFCDDDFNDDVRGNYSRRLAAIADAVVASTPELAKVLGGLTSAAVSTVTDPVEGIRGAPRVPQSASASLHLIWYGHPTNLRTLEMALPQLDASALRFRLDIITSANAGGEDLAARAAEAWQSTGGTCRFIEWSLDATWGALAACDAVVIPSDPYDPARAMKSPNRFTEGIWAGRFVLAHRIPAYAPLADFGWVGEDLGEGLRWLLTNPAAALERIKAGQDAVAERYSSQAIGREWMQVIDAAVQESSP
jgi:hypothetical protein